MTELQQEGVLSTLTPEQTDKLFHSPAMRRLFQKNASDEYALIWLLSKHMKDSGSEKIYLKDMVREMNLPLPKVTAIARSLQNKGLVTWTHDGNGEEGTYIMLTELAVSSVRNSLSLSPSTTVLSASCLASTYTCFPTAIPSPFPWPMV